MSETAKTDEKILVVSAPSGTGKTTLNRRLISEYTKIEMSISHTTRLPRLGESDGVHYHFVSRPKFEEMVLQHQFLEWAHVHNNLYGTSKSELVRIAERKKTPLLEIDVQGWRYARKHIPQAISIFILPPTLETLWHRLATRGSDGLSIRWLRLQNAYHEIEGAEIYQYFIVNDNLEVAYQELVNIVIHGQKPELDPMAGRDLCLKLKQEFYHADWINKLRLEIELPSMKNGPI